MSATEPVSLPEREQYGRPVFWDNRSGEMSVLTSPVKDLFVSSGDSEKTLAVTSAATVQFTQIPSFARVMQYSSNDDPYSKPLSEVAVSSSYSEFKRSYGIKMAAKASSSSISGSASFQVAGDFESSDKDVYLSRVIYMPEFMVEIQPEATLSPDYLAQLTAAMPAGEADTDWSYFFKTWGSHYRSACYLGAIGMLISHSSAFSSISDSSLKTAVSAKYDGLVNEGKVSADVKVSKTASDAIDKAAFAASGRGGDVTQLSEMSDWADQGKFNAWLESTNHMDNAKIVGYRLSGIWLLIQDETVAATLQARYEKIFQPAVTDVKVNELEVRVTTADSDNADTNSKVYLVLPDGSKQLLNDSNDNFERGQTDVFKIVGRTGPLMSFENLTMLQQSSATLKLDYDKDKGGAWEIENYQLIGFVEWTKNSVQETPGWLSLAGKNNLGIWLGLDGKDKELAISFNHADFTNSPYTGTTYFSFSLNLTIGDDEHAGSPNTINLVLYDKDYPSRKITQTVVKDPKRKQSVTVTVVVPTDKGWPNGISDAKLKAYLEIDGDNAAQIASYTLTGFSRNINEVDVSNTADIEVAIASDTSPFWLSTDTNDADGTAIKQKTIFAAAEEPAASETTKDVEVVAAIA